MAQVTVIVPNTSSLCLTTKDFAQSSYGLRLREKLQAQLDAFLALNNSLAANHWDVIVFGISDRMEHRHIQVNVETEGFAEEDREVLMAFGSRLGAIVQNEFKASPLMFTRTTVMLYKICGATDFPPAARD